MLSLQDDLPSSLHLLAGASVLPIGWRDCCTSSVRLLPAARDLIAALTLSISVLDRGSNADVKSTLVTDSVRALMHSSPGGREPARSEEHTSELQSLMLLSYAVFFLKKKM